MPRKLAAFESSYDAERHQSEETERARGAAVFVAIVSPAYVQSQSSMFELSSFRHEHQDALRLLKVLKAPLTRPVEDPLPDIVGFPFFRTGEAPDDVREFATDSEEFFVAIDRVALAISRILSDDTKR